jgi:hypothetical protein
MNQKKLFWIQQQDAANNDRKLVRGDFLPRVDEIIFVDGYPRRVWTVSYTPDEFGELHATAIYK